MAQISGRYKLESVLGAGSYGTTHLARDLHKPSHPFCVVKQLRQHTPKILTLFQQEAVMLERLGRHPQIPELIAYFSEDDQFYIVQEYIDGYNLRQELQPSQALDQDSVLQLLQNVLTVLSFVHRHHVIHRDIKPENLMRRRTDGQIFLIDFGTVKQLSNSDIDGRGNVRVTVTVGTSGYMPIEQRQGSPCLGSDLYALGMVAIEALTGMSPRRLELNPDTFQTNWQTYATVSPALADFLNQLTHWHANHRLYSAQEALEQLNGITESLLSPPLPVQTAPTPSQAHPAPGHAAHPPLKTLYPERLSMPPQPSSEVGIENPPRDPGSVVAQGGTPDICPDAPTAHGESTPTDVVAPAYQDETTLPPPLRSRQLPLKPIATVAMVGLALLLAWGLSLKAVERWQRWQNGPAVASIAPPRYPEATANQLVCLFRNCQPGDRLRPAAFNAFWQMWAAAREEGVQLRPIGAFQSIQAQRQAMETANDMPAGKQQRWLYQSDYHTGYGVAIGDAQAPDTNRQRTFEETRAFKWLQQNAGNFGFQLAYPKRNKVGVEYKPWHWRYVGDSESQQLFGVR